MSKNGTDATYVPAGDNDPQSDGMQRFSATGKPYSPKDSTYHAYDSMMADGSFANVQANHLPFKYTDDSLIPVPVRKDHLSTDEKPRRKSFLSKLKGKNEGNEGFTIKQIRRGDYLKHYAKDEKGWYCGTDEPADDCILRDGDPTKALSERQKGWRGGNEVDVNSLGGSTLAQEHEGL